MTQPDLRVDFLKAALWHGSLDEAERILAAHPDLGSGDIHVAAVLGDDETVRACLARDPSSVHASSPPYGGDALNYLCLSKYLRLRPERTESFLRTATALLDAGADPNTGFWTTGDHPEHETALYGAAGVAHHGPLTRLLLERGADPNDPEVVYHSPEEYDLAAMQAAVGTGRVTPGNLVLMLVRKHDWHDEPGVRYLLEHGTNPNLGREQGLGAVHHAIARDNDLPIITLLLDHGADFSVIDTKYGIPAIAHAARRGRSDILDELEQRGIDVTLHGVDRLIAACARHDSTLVRTIADESPALAAGVRHIGGKLLAEFAGNGNTHGVACLLELGVPVDAPFVEGDGYWSIAPNSTALHVAAWRSSHDVVRLLIERGADVNVKDDRGRTPLVLAIKACVDSYWTESRSTESIAPLLAAGASTDGVTLPTGYDEADALIARA
jgi:ankyrin repeat protein